jgi:hypothetical protein
MSKRVVEGDVSDAKRSKVSEEQQSLGPIEAEERKEAESVLARAKKMGLVLLFSPVVDRNPQPPNAT